MTSALFQDKDSSEIYDEFQKVESTYDEQNEDEYREDKLEQMISRYGY
jgi:hypothetical protein